MAHFFNAIRSALFVLFMAITVIPWALAVLVVSIFAKGNVVYWMCVGWLHHRDLGREGDLRRARAVARHREPARLRRS